MLKSRKKITKKELKKDPVLVKISQIERFLKKRSRLVTYIAIVAVAAIIMSTLLIRSKRLANREASGELGIAQISIERGDYDDAILKLENIVDKYRGTESAGMATVLLAQSYMIKGNYQKAEDNYFKYVKNYKRDILLIASSYGGIGVCYEIKNDPLRAAEYFEKAGSVTKYKFQKHEFYLNSARNWIKAGNLQKAESLIQIVLSENPDFNYKSAAEELLAKIELLSS